MIGSFERSWLISERGYISGGQTNACFALKSTLLCFPKICFVVISLKLKFLFLWVIFLGKIHSISKPLARYNMHLVCGSLNVSLIPLPLETSLGSSPMDKLGSTFFSC